MKIVLNTKEIGKLLRSEEVTHELERIGTEMLAEAGEGYEMETYVPNGKKKKGAKKKSVRSNVSVYPATYMARKDNWNNNTLVKLSRKKRG